jgi:hypothetical protein
MKRQQWLLANGFGNQLPPSWHQVRIYFAQQTASIKQATAFFKFYQQRNRQSKRGIPLQNWKKLACTWIWYRAQPY